MQLKLEHNLQTRPTIPLLAEATYKLQSGETLLISSRMPHLIDHDETGIVTPSAHLEQCDTFFLVSSLSTVNNNAVKSQICNFLELPYTLPPEQLKFITDVNPSTLTFIMHQQTEVTYVYPNELLQGNKKMTKRNSMCSPNLN